MAKLPMFPAGEDKKQHKLRQAAHDEQLRQEQVAREKLYPPTLSRLEFEEKRAVDLADAEAADELAIAASPNYREPPEQE